ncbi:MAG: helix-turn-helix transcriptional regulator [Solirubrobacterales bacterium]
MAESSPIGRTEERVKLRVAANSAATGHGSLVLLSGEAGIGKTRLVEDVLDEADLRLLRAAATPAGSPYGPITAALRAFLREVPGGLDNCGMLTDQLAVLLPELGPAGEVGDPETLVEAIRCALVAVAAEQPTALLLDDLQWSDEATLEALVRLAPTLADMRLLIVAAYRNDELLRSHPLRRLRTDLNRERLLMEIALNPLNARESEALVAELLEVPASPRLMTTLSDRSGGNPFFLAELALALDDTDRLIAGPEGLQLSLDSSMPLPSTVRDAVLVRTSQLPAVARESAEVAAVIGNHFDIGMVAELGAGDGIADLLAAGLLAEEEDGWAAFRHPLERDAIYEDVPWLRRSELHRRIAELLEVGDADRSEVAAHWLAARDTSRALDALLAAIAQRDRVHAHRDATRLGTQALELWPEGERAEERITTLEAHAVHAELAGDLTEAARAQREVVAARRSAGAGRALADAERRIAGIYALQGDRPRALAARRVAAEAYAANSLPGEAAGERLVIAGYLQAAGEHTEAASVAATARAEGMRADRVELRARAMGVEGIATVKGGAFDEGIEMIREGLSLALKYELTSETAELYQRLGSAFEIAGDYQGAAVALDTAIGFCETGGEAALEYVCLSCMAYVLRELGDWTEVDLLCERLITPDAPAHDTLVADGVLGATEAWRGRPRAALELLTRCHDSATKMNVVSMQCDSAAALAWHFAQEGDVDHAYEYCRMLLDRWERSEDHHYAVWGLRWAAGWLAANGHVVTARECADALSSIVASAGNPDALAALACALGETALADGDTATAVQHLDRACDLYAGLHIPFELASVQLRSGVVLAAAGERDRAIERLVEAYSSAGVLGATTVAAAAANELTSLDASLDEHLGSRAADELERYGLSRREHEVVRLVAEGLTNKEIATRLILSTRTIDAHLRSILTKLDCRTRTEAASRAAESGLLDV